MGTPKTVEQVTAYAVKEGSTVLQIRETQGDADNQAAALNLESAITDARAEIETYNQDAADNIITISFDINNSGSLADLHTALENIKSTYGLTAAP